MADNLDLRTASMAKVLVEQGHYEKALEIYRFLAEQHPERNDFALALTETQRSLERQNRMRDLAGLVREWISLLLDMKRMEHLHRMRGQLLKDRRKST